MTIARAFCKVLRESDDEERAKLRATKRQASLNSIMVAAVGKRSILSRGMPGMASNRTLTQT